MDQNKSDILNLPVLIILAGGKSSRMGLPKGLLNYKDHFWLEEQLRRANKAKFDFIILVLGYDCLLYLEKLPFLNNNRHDFVFYKDLKIKIVINKKPHLGAFSSLVLALKCVLNKKSVFVLPIDVPLIKRSELIKLTMSNTLVTVPEYKGKKGHPVRLNYNFWKLLPKLDLEAMDARLDFQIKKINKKFVTLYKVNDKESVLNLNTTEEWDDFLILNK